MLPAAPVNVAMAMPPAFAVLVAALKTFRRFFGMAMFIPMRVRVRMFMFVGMFMLVFFFVAVIH